MAKKKLFSKSSKENKNVHVSPDKSSFFKSPKFAALLVALAFGAIGGIYLISSKAATPLGSFTLKISTINTAGQSINGVNVTMTGCTPNILGQGCNIFSQSCSPSSAIINGSTNFSCNGVGGAIVTGISANGYHLSPSSQIKVGGLFLSGGSPLQQTGLNTWAGTITMEANAPSPAPPAPPAPTPTPSPVTHSSSSSSTSHTTTTAKAAAPAATPAATSSDTPADTTTTSDNEEQLDSGFTTNVPKGKATTLTSYDDQVKVSFPKGAFDTDAYCSIDTADNSNVPVKSKDLIGPYGLDCVDSEGNTLDKLKKEITVTFTLPTDKKTYIAYTYGDKWTEAAKGKGKTLGVKMDKLELFAAAPAKSTNWFVIIIDIGAIILVLLVIAGIVRLIKRRSQLDEAPNTTAEEYYQDYMSAQGQQVPGVQEQGQNPGDPPLPPPPGPPAPPVPPA